MPQAFDDPLFERAQKVLSDAREVSAQFRAYRSRSARNGQTLRLIGEDASEISRRVKAAREHAQRAQLNRFSR